MATYTLKVKNVLLDAMTQHFSLTKTASHKHVQSHTHKDI